MAPLGEKIQTALDEARILILGTQVLLGFEYRSFFEARFAGLPEGARIAKLAAVSIEDDAASSTSCPGWSSAPTAPPCSPQSSRCA